jgi:IPT/TIG domain
MAVFYGVPAGKTLMVAGPADVTIKGGEMPLIVDTIEEAQAARPTISALDPSSAESGAADLVLTVSGDKFDGNSVIVFGQYDEPTTLTPDGTLTTGVKPSLFAPATVPVKVRNGPAHSDSLDFTFTEPAARGARRS